MGRLLLAFSVFLVAACGPTAAQPTTTPTAVGAGQLLSQTEAKLLSATSLHVTSTIVASGAVSAEITVQVDLTAGNKLRFHVVGLFNGTKVDTTYVSNGTLDHKGESVPAHLQQAVVVGMVRMGLLHNVASLVAGKPPARAEGGVETWVTASEPVFAQQAAAASSTVPGTPQTRTVSFKVMVAGRPSGEAEVSLAKDTLLPTGRFQKVVFPSGTMSVKETYQIHMAPQVDVTNFLTVAECRGAHPCVAKLCAKGDLRACENAASQLIFGREVAKDVRAGIALSQKTCMAGHPSSCLVAAYHMWWEDKMKAYTAARKLNKSGLDGWAAQCRLGNALACSERKLASRSMRRLVGWTAVRHFGVGCRAGDAKACIGAARVHANGVGVPPNHTLALRIAAPLCGTHADACYVMARLYKGSKSADYFIKGCKLGSMKSCQEAIGVLARLPARAAELAELRVMACNKKWMPDKHCVAGALARPMNDPKRLGMLEAGCDASGVRSCIQLARMRRLGKSKDALRLSAITWQRVCMLSRKAPLCTAYLVEAKKANLLRRRADRLTAHRTACEFGRILDSCTRATRLTNKNPVPYHQVLCRGGVLKSCYRAGAHYATPGAVAQPGALASVRDAKTWFKLGCAGGDFASCYKLGKLSKACADGKGYYDACLALATKSQNTDGKDGTVTNARDNACRLACRAWKKRDRRDRRASGKNPRTSKTCRKVKRCR